MQRSWCIAKIGQAKVINTRFQLIYDNGDLVKSDVKTLEEISEFLLKFRTYNTNINNESGSLAIHYRLLDSSVKMLFTSFEFYTHYSNLINVN